MPGTPSRMIAESWESLVAPAPTPSLPAVVHLTLVAEGGGAELGGRWLDQVLLLGEQIVVGPQHGASGRAGGEIG